MNFAVNKNKLVGSYSVDKKDVPSILMEMKFDAIVGNPPYNAPKEKIESHNQKLATTTTLWPKFVEKSFECLNDGGYLALVHPIGWRAFKGFYSDTAQLYLNNNLVYVRMNDVNMGQKQFGVGTPFDVVISQKSPYTGKTELVGYNNDKVVTDISGWKCIPSGEFSDTENIIAKETDSTLEIVYNTKYHGNNPRGNISRKKTNRFCLSVVHAVNVKHEPTFIYTNKDEGMFGVTKVIFGRRSCGVIVDLDGKYACSQQTRHIVCTRAEAQKILKAMKNPKFIELMSYLSWGGTAADRYDLNAFRLLRKDFWREFI